MKKISRLILCFLATVNVFATTAFAAVPSQSVYTSVNEQSILCEKNVKYNTETVYSVARRGTFFDSASVTIRDEGNGDIGVSAHANLRQPAEELYVSLYLDRYDEKKGKWYQVDYVDFEYTIEEYPDGIEDPSIHITFVNQKKGYYYRIRGAFTAAIGYDYEGLAPITEGIWIE